jgi:thiazole/oxazole-forming peptide maturase SagD family component
MVSPLCGLDRMLVFSQRSREGPRFIVGGAELTGVHHLLNQADPGSYHIGGVGVVLHEAVIRALGETVERYAQFVSAFGARHPVTMAAYAEMAERRLSIPAPETLAFFSEAQHASPAFPFRPFDPSRPLGWVKAVSLPDRTEAWVPAQLVLLGYRVRHDAGEPWLLPAVTTGTAAHTRPDQALRNALLELVQVDAAMGHWYSAATAPQIVLDERTKPLERLIARQFGARRPTIRFHWLGSPDLPGLIVACVIKGAPGQIPAVGVGLGADLELVPAMYKALLEAVGVMQLAKVNLVNRAMISGKRAEGAAEPIDPARILDLDTNVGYYALPENAPVIDEKFVVNRSVPASSLPAGSGLTTEQELRLLVDGFRRTKKSVVFLDLTADDVRQLGFVVARVWSPDTLSLCFPSAPPTRHPRFGAYGGVAHRNPHPYP